MLAEAHPLPDHIGLWIWFLLVVALIGAGAFVVRWWFHRVTPPPVAPQEPPGRPEPSPLTDTVRMLPMQWGKPVRHRYDPEEYELPLICITCGQPILEQAEFWEVPILNDKDRPDDAMQAVCLQCDSRSPYDKLEESS